jgi:hypothetical protein
LHKAALHPGALSSPRGIVVALCSAQISFSIPPRRCSVKGGTQTQIIPLTLTSSDDPHSPGPPPTRTALDSPT